MAPRLAHPAVPCACVPMPIVRVVRVDRVQAVLAVPVPVARAVLRHPHRRRPVACPPEVVIRPEVVIPPVAATRRVACLLQAGVSST